MKKYALGFIFLAVLQVIILFAIGWLVITLRSDCSFTGGSMGEWQCSSDSDPTIIPIIAFAILPPAVSKPLLGKLKLKFSWKEIVLAHALAALVVLGLLAYLGASSCGCGGA